MKALTDKRVLINQLRGLNTETGEMFEGNDEVFKYILVNRNQYILVYVCVVLPGIFVVKAQSNFIDSMGVGHDHVEAILQTKSV